MINRTVGSVFMTQLVAFRGAEQKQGVNGKMEVLAIANEDIRADIQEGDFVICRVEERTASLRDEAGNPLLNADGTPQLSNDKFVRNEVVACGTYEEIAARFYSDEIMELKAAAFIKTAATAPAIARVRKPVNAAGAEPVVGADAPVVGG